jgi:hypothetical protein
LNKTDASVYETEQFLEYYRAIKNPKIQDSILQFLKAFFIAQGVFFVTIKIRH